MSLTPRSGLAASALAQTEIDALMAMARRRTVAAGDMILETRLPARAPDPNYQQDHQSDLEQIARHARYFPHHRLSRTTVPTSRLTSLHHGLRSAVPALITGRESAPSLATAPAA